MEEHTEDAKVSEEVAKLPVGRISHHEYFFLKKINLKRSKLQFMLV
jgi:hypothetical protein